MKPRMSPRLALVVIASLFVLPLALALLMYSGAIDYDPVKTRNLGTLVQPPVPAGLSRLSPGADLETHWVILHALAVPCGATCLETAAGLRQLHRATGRNQPRIRLVMTAPEIDGRLTQELGRIYPEFRLARADIALQTTLADVAGGPGWPGAYTYLLDPLGNIMMVYEPGSDPNDLKKDLKRLLTWSKLDEN